MVAANDHSSNNVSESREVILTPANPPVITPPSKPVGAPLVGKPPPNVSKISLNNNNYTTTTPVSTVATIPPVPTIPAVPTPPVTPLPPPLVVTTTTPDVIPIPPPPTPPTVVVAKPDVILVPVVEYPPVGMYEEIEDNSSEILGFDDLKGFGMKVRTTVHSQVGLDTTLSFPLAAGVAFAYASVPLNRILIKKDTSEALANPTLPPPLPYHIPIKSFYINAMIDPSQTFHVDYLHRYSQLMSLKLYGVSSLFEKDSTDICGKLLFDKPNYNVQLKAATDSQYMGASFLRRVAPKWYLGSEVFFSNTQKSGGFSAGTQYFDKASPHRPQWTATVNTMGDLTTTFTSAIVPSILTASARYNFNTNSHDSEVGLGVSYTPKDLPLTVKARWDNSNRWGVLATLRIALGKVNLLATAGISSSEQPSKAPTYGAVLSIDF